MLADRCYGPYTNDFNPQRYIQDMYTESPHLLPCPNDAFHSKLGLVIDNLAQSGQNASLGHGYRL